MKTPWGQSQTVKNHGLGILTVTTASHGGMYVPKEHLHRIPQKYQDYAVRWSQSPQWYEEDVASAIVIAYFPELFSREQIDYAATLLTNWIDR